MRCDCEHERCEHYTVHRAGCCKNSPRYKVSVYGHKMNICDSCLAFNFMTPVFPVSEQLKVEFHVVTE
jgi:uncharacterized membrane protein